MDIRKILAVLSLVVSFGVAATANATEITVRVQNLSTATMVLSSSSVSGFPSSLAPGGDVTFTTYTPNSSSNIQAVYTKGSSACDFKGSHVANGSGGATFNHSATSVGAIYAYCGSTQTVVNWGAPFNYRLRFLMTD